MSIVLVFMPRKKKNRRRPHIIRYFAGNFGIVFGMVLIWRGIWYILDYIDKLAFNGQHIITAILGVVTGFALLYLPDKNLDEIKEL